MEIFHGSFKIDGFEDEYGQLGFKTSQLQGFIVFSDHFSALFTSEVDYARAVHTCGAEPMIMVRRDTCPWDSRSLRSLQCSLTREDKLDRRYRNHILYKL